jgi:micrococcal nuclease
MTRLLALVAAAIVAVAGVNGSDAARSATSGVVASIIDGDTLRLADGRRVRLVQIDTPELGTGECYSRAARTALLQRVPLGSRVVLERDPALDDVDRYGRLLRYVHRGTMNVNVALVRAGAAEPYFYDGDRGRHAGRLMSEALAARAARRGLWGACPQARLDPYRAVETGTSRGANAVMPARPLVPAHVTCDASYAGACVPPPPPDLDCRDLRAKSLALPVRVVGGDPHRLDGDGDGYGCE